jgi:hypothetical protein
MFGINVFFFFGWFVTNFCQLGDPKKKKEAVNHSKVFCWEKNGPKLPFLFYFWNKSLKSPYVVAP